MDMHSNIASMTDDALVEYVTKLSTKLSLISRLPSGSGAAEQISQLLFLARRELSERAAATAFKQMLASRPAETSSDPDLLPKTEETVPEKTSKPQINRIQVRRSDRPTSSVDLSPSPPTEKDKE